MTRTRGPAAAAVKMAKTAARSAFTRASLPFWVGGAAVVAVLGGFVGLGGLRSADTDPDVVAAGDEVATSLYAATVLDVELADTVESQFLKAEPGETLLVVTFDLENLSERAIGIDRSADRVESGMLSSRTPLLELSGVTATGAARSWRADDSTRAVILQPGVPAEVKIAWPVSERLISEHGARLNIYDATERTGKVIVSSSTISWQRADLTAQVALEVER